MRIAAPQCTPLIGFACFSGSEWKYGRWKCGMCTCDMRRRMLGVDMRIRWCDGDDE